MNRIILITVLPLFLFSNCITEDSCPVVYRYQDQTNYEITPEFVTPSGLAVDPTGQDVSAALVDELTDKVERCLIEEFGDPPVIPEDVMEKGMCRSNTFALPISRECLTVKVPDDWVMSCDQTQQLLPAPAPDQLCRDKGLEPSAECPCRWRAGIQDHQTIVVTPSFYLYNDPLIRIVTGCNNPWGHPALQRCATPSVPPL